MDSPKREFLCRYMEDDDTRFVNVFAADRNEARENFGKHHDVDLLLDILEIHADPPLAPPDMADLAAKLCGTKKGG